MIRKLGKIFLWYVLLFFCACTSMPEKIQQHCIQGKVVDKKKPELSHGVLEVYISNSCDSSLNWFFVKSSDEKFWNYLNLGDSLFKDKDTLLIMVKKPHESKWFRLTKW